VGPKWNQIGASVSEKDSRKFPVPDFSSFWKTNWYTLSNLMNQVL